MFYQEIKPGVFISNEQKVHFKLEQCPYCGRVDLLSHHKYTDRCIDCGNTYNLYAVRRNARCKERLTRKSTRAHLELLESYVARRAAGLRVPNTLDEELVETRKLVANLDELEAVEAARQQMVTVDCIYCGKKTQVPLGAAPPHRCDKCKATYKRYKDLYNKVDALEPTECDEFAGLITYYVGMQQRGYRVPRISWGIGKLNRRLLALGAERRKFYVSEAEDNEDM